MVDISKRRADRTRLMQAVFDEAEGQQIPYVDAAAIAERLGMSEAEATEAALWLEGEGLLIVEGWGVGALRLTHQGIREVEESRESPATGTEHLVPLNQIVIHGNVTGSVQQAGRDVVGDVQVSADDRRRITEFVDLFKAEQDDLGLAADQLAEAQAEVVTVEAQLQSPRPKVEVVRASLGVLRDFALTGSAGVALSKAVAELPFW